jgi:hypothetical protein
MWVSDPTACFSVGQDSCRSHIGEQILCVGSTSSGWECDEGRAKQLEQGGNAVLLGCMNRPFVGTHISPVNALRPSGIGPDSLQPRSPSALQKESHTQCITHRNQCFALLCFALLSSHLQVKPKHSRQQCAPHYRQEGTLCSLNDMCKQYQP